MSTAIHAKTQLTLEQYRLSYVYHASTAKTVRWVLLGGSILFAIVGFPILAKFGGETAGALAFLPAALLSLCLNPTTVRDHTDEKLEKQFEGRPFKNKKVSWRIDDDGITPEAGSDHETHLWKYLHAIKETPDGFLVYPREDFYYWWPTGSFDSEEDIAAFRKLAKSHGKLIIKIKEKATLGGLEPLPMPEMLEAGGDYGAPTAKTPATAPKKAAAQAADAPKTAAAQAADTEPWKKFSLAVAGSIIGFIVFGFMMGHVEMASLLFLVPAYLAIKLKFPAVAAPAEPSGETVKIKCRMDFEAFCQSDINHSYAKSMKSWSWFFASAAVAAVGYAVLWTAGSESMAVACIFLPMIVCAVTTVGQVTERPEAELKQAFDDQKFKDLEFNWKVNPAGIEYVAAKETTRISWEDVRRLVETPDGFVGYFGDEAYFWLPKSGFASEADLEQFRVIAQSVHVELEVGKQRFGGVAAATKTEGANQPAAAAPARTGEPITLKCKMTFEQFLLSQRYHERVLSWESWRWFSVVSVLAALGYGVLWSAGSESLAVACIFIPMIVCFVTKVGQVNERSETELKQVFDRQRFKDQEFEWSAGESGISYVSGSDKALFSWYDVQRVVETPDGFLAYMSKEGYSWLPAASFTSQDGAARLRHLLQSRQVQRRTIRTAVSSQ